MRKGKEINGLCEQRTHTNIHIIMPFGLCLQFGSWSFFFSLFFFSFFLLLKPGSNCNAMRMRPFHCSFHPSACNPTWIESLGVAATTFGSVQHDWSNYNLRHALAMLVKQWMRLHSTVPTSKLIIGFIGHYYDYKLHKGFCGAAKMYSMMDAAQKSNGKPYEPNGSDGGKNTTATIIVYLL